MHPLVFYVVVSLACLLSACGAPDHLVRTTLSLNVTVETGTSLGEYRQKVAVLPAPHTSPGSEHRVSVKGFGAPEQGHLNLLQLDEVWALSQGEGVTVAVIDSGVDPNHPSLAGAVLPGYDFVAGTPLVSDPHGHGTAIAVLIAGRGELRGIAPQAKILPLRVLNEHNQGAARTVARAILYAANLLEGQPNPYPADIINLSLGSEGYSAPMHDAIRQAKAAGVNVVAAVGNHARRTLAYPAALPEVVAVGAAEVAHGNWQSAPYSNTGAGLSLVAPLGGLTDTNRGRYGEAGVVSADVSGTEKTYSGTSFAAPQISAVLALLRALEQSSAEAERLLVETSSDLSAQGWDAATGFGLVNPRAALRAAHAQASTLPVAVQFLDAGSLQESGFYTSATQASFDVVPGRYVLNVWLDENRDGLWQQAEPSYRSGLTDIDGVRTAVLSVTLR